MSKENLYSGKRILDNNIDDIIPNLEKNLKIIENESKKIFIVNAGRMNHGKSSLFNSLLDKQYFATGDVRTTVARSDAEFRPNVFLVDTPGLDAVDCDDKAALIKNSGVDELRLFLIKKLTQWKTEANVLAKERKNKLIKDVCNELTSERDEYEKECYIKHKKIEQYKQNVIKIIDEIFAEIEEYQKYLRNNMRVVNQLEEKVRDLQQKHIQEKRNYY